MPVEKLNVLSLRNEEKAGLIIAIIIRSEPIRKTEDHKKVKKATKMDKIFLLLWWRRDNKLCLPVILKKRKRQNKKDVDPLSFLSTLHGWILPWAFSRKLITWARFVTLAILWKTPRKIDRYYPFAEFKSTQKFLHALKKFFDFSFVCFHCKKTSHFGKVNKKVKTERSAIKLRLSPRVWDSQVSTSSPLPHLPCYSLKRPINYCCRTSPILCMIFKICMFIKTLCRTLFTKYAHYKPLFPFENNI